MPGHQHRVELGSLVAPETRRRDQTVDQPGPLSRVGGCDKSARLGRSGNPPGQVERQPADQGRIVGRGRRIDASSAKDRVDVMIDHLADGTIGGQQVGGTGAG